jgi:dihydrolipoamide dehydrogenase
VTAARPKRQLSARRQETPKQETTQARVVREEPRRLSTEIVVLGSGPGGYAAAFRAADLGKKTVLVERYPTLGGVCLNVGCIPSKALLHVAGVMHEVESLAAAGITYGTPRRNLERLRQFKDDVVGRLVRGLSRMAEQRRVAVLEGEGRLIGAHEMTVEGKQGEWQVTFEHAILAPGSSAVRLPFLPDDERIMTSTAALALGTVPKRLLVIGGGIIGLEMATVYAALGSSVTVVELLGSLLPGIDRDLVRAYNRSGAKRFEQVLVETRVTAVEPRGKSLRVVMSGPGGERTGLFDRVLVAVGRRANGDAIGAAAAGLSVAERGVLRADAQQRTEVLHLLAVGDVTGEPMLAHRATHQGKVAAEVAAGLKTAFEARVIPAVAYTDPEVGWVGLSEEEAKRQGREVAKGVFPWSASGRSLAMGRNDGMTKLLFDPATKRLLGAAVVGPRAGDLIAEAALAIEMGCDAHDLSLTVHPHPTLSETVSMAAEVFTGTVTDLYLPR